MFVIVGKYKFYDLKLGKFAYIIFSIWPECSSVKYSRYSAGLRAFGAHLRKVRKARGLSQEQLAWKADLELSQISRIERGIISAGLSQLFMIAGALEIHIKELFDFETPKEEEV